MAGRTDTHQLTVLNQTTGARFSTTGSKAECEKAAVAKVKEWRGDKCETLITKR